MSRSRKKQDASGGQTSPAGPEKVIPGTRRDEPAERKPDKAQVVAPDEDRLATKERKRLFAENLDMLIGLVGMNRKEAADAIGIAHKLVRRLVSAGVGRKDARNIESLTRIVAYFVLPSIDDLWRADLLRRLLSTNEGHGFVEKFRPRLLVERERRLAEEQARSHEELGLLSRALGFETAPPLTGPYADKVAQILASAKAEQFKRMIDDYFELAFG